MKNNSFVEIGNELKKAKRIYIFPHISMDGDAVGSSVALASAMRSLGISSHILLEDEIPENLQFMAGDFFLNYEEADLDCPYTSVCVDCSDSTRFPKREEAFFGGSKTVCIDHHQTGKAVFDFNYIDPKAAATAELIFELVEAMEIPISLEIGEAVFLGIDTDSGKFQYSNTSKKTHLIAAKLADAGVDFNKVSTAFFENKSIEEVKLKSHILANMQIVAGGKAVIGVVTQELLKDLGAKLEYSEGAVAELRSLRGVEISALLKEQADGKIKVSLRAKSYANVADIAVKFGGGGHIKAAGFTLDSNMEEAIKIITTEVEKEFV